MTIFAHSTTVAGGCGIGVFANFHVTDRYGDKRDLKLAPHQGGAGYLLVHFIVGDKVCDKAYTILAKRFPIAFQSEIRRNLNSNNDVYFCVYDTKDKCASGFAADDDYFEELDNDDNEDKDEGF